MNKGHYNYIDLFSGIGGFRQGLDLSEIKSKCLLSCEIDKSAREVYSKLYGVENDFNINDVHKLRDDGEDLNKEYFFDDIKELSKLSRSKLEKLINGQKVDLLCGGFPCQPFSRSGRRKGFEDENKGNLFFDVLKLVDKLKPEKLLLENVKGLLTLGESVPVSEDEFGFNKNRRKEINKGKTFLDIVNYLLKAGYDVEWQVLNSNLVLPHKRERVFIFAQKQNDNLENKKIFPIILNDNQSSNYKKLSNKYRNMSSRKLLKVDNLEKYKISSIEDDLELIDCTNENKFEFNTKTPFQNWGVAFKLDKKQFIITKKMKSDIFKEKKNDLLDYLETDFEKIKSSNIPHIYVLRQLWSKSGKTVSTGNKMGNMSYPDSPLRPSRTLTATDSLGREAMVVGYYFDVKNQINYIKPLENRYQLLYMTKKQSDEKSFKKLSNKFNDRGTTDYTDKIEIIDKNSILVNAISVDNNEVELSYFLNNNLKKNINQLYMRKLTAKERWELQGFLDPNIPLRDYYRKLDSKISSFDDLISVVGIAQLIKQAGNAVTVNIIKKIADEIDELN